MKDAYTFPADIVGQIKRVLDQLTGTPVRLLHNEIDHHIAVQNKAQAEAQAKAAHEALLAEARAEVAKQQLAANDG